MVYPKGGYLANRQMAKKVRLTGVLFVIWDACSQLKWPEANGFRSRSPVTLDLFLESYRSPISRQRTEQGGFCFTEPSV